MKHEKQLHPTRWLNLSVPAAFALAFVAGAAHAQSVPQVGSNNVAIADASLPRPDTKPCVVELFPKRIFASTGDNKRMDAEPQPFKYSPPKDCNGPWAKVVLEANFSVDEGYQYDRTASIWLKGVNLYFGTTQEPSPGTPQSWQVQRDLTDYSGLLSTPGDGMAWVNNWLDSVRSAKIYADAKLLFYPADAKFPAPSVPDVVYALNGEGTTPANLKTANDQLVRNIAFPKNTVQVYLDVFAQPQFHDEFYYMCLDEKFIQQTTQFAIKRGYKGAPKKPRACEGGSFREVAVSIDGKPAGLAPISPWVFTGGVDPYLWRPTPAVETLNFMPYRVDLTPFAGQLSDGNEHSVAVRVLDADNFFSVAASLLVYRDAGTDHTGGAVTGNSLQGMSLEPTVTSTLGTISAPGVNGDVDTHASKNYVIEGYVNTSRGKVETRVESNIRFGNVQQFLTISDAAHRHVVRQTAHVESTSSSTGGGSLNPHLRQTTDYSLYIDTLNGTDDAQRSDRIVSADQSFERHIAQGMDGMPLYQASIRNSFTGSDHVSFDQKDRRSYKDRDQSSVKSYTFRNSLGDCYQAEVQAREGKVSHVSSGMGCNMDTSSLHWFVRPDGSPDSFGWRQAAKH